MPASLTLSDNARTRYATGSLMYFAQGIPQGLLAIAIPAWLATKGASPGQISMYLAVIVLPWAFKLAAGPFMDRYMYLPMGRRRPWVIVAQLGLTVSLLGLALIHDPLEQLKLLTLLGAIINTFAATQDVAVDGMCIDLTPVREQGRLNAFMSFGKAVGWAVTAAVSGVILDRFGMPVAAVTASVAAGVILLMFTAILEKEGEKRLPWSRGEARSARGSGGSFKEVFGGIHQVLWTRASVVILLIMFSDGLVSGYGHALMPVAAVNVFGYTTTQWSQLVAIVGLIGAGVALGMGPGIDRFGSKWMMVLNLSLLAVHAFLLGGTQFLWENSLYVRAMLSFWVLMVPVVMVCAIALAMSICSSTASATQFAIYMSTANLGYSAGSRLYGIVADGANHVDTYVILGILSVVTMTALLFHRHRQGHAGEGGREKTPRYTVGTGSPGAGMFFSGAIRCPKCRSDMDQVVHDGVEIDRCVHCGGIWFDAGEVQLLASSEAAAAIDPGEAKVGKQYNAIHEYRCPRCGGGMEKHVDPKQRHIWYETCADCRGSFFDAGEFRDLAQHDIMDFFKNLMAGQRS
ncbi:MAG TPA: MFS transporter [Longimicrobiales bacterium]|nr:MFS transporter [Longimicrobiales bacterium]